MSTFNMFENYPDVVSIDDLMEMLRIGKNTAYKLVNEKRIKSIRIAGKYKIPKCCVIEFLQSAG